MTVHTCYRCGYLNSTIEKDSISQHIGDSCRNCLHPFQRCFLNFDALPLVEFHPCTSISHEEALAAICKHPTNETTGNDLFNEAISKTLTVYQGSIYKPVEVNIQTLEALQREDIYVLKRSSRYFRNMIPEIGLAVCQNCHSFFHEEDYEYAFTKEGFCPVCESKLSHDVSPNCQDS